MKKRILTEEHKRKIGLAHIGKTLSEETREKISKARINGLEKGKIKSYIRDLKHREFMSKIKKGVNKGKTWEEKFGKEKSDELKKIYCERTTLRNIRENPASNIEVRKKISNSRIKGLNEGRIIPWNKGKICPQFSMENNPRWLGGKSFEPYTPDFNNRFKRAIRNRDNHLCLKCGIHQERLNKTLTVHHINYDKLLTIQENCCTLCIKCNSEVNSNRKHWIKFFQSILSEKYNYKYSEDNIPIINIEVGKLN